MTFTQKTILTFASSVALGAPLSAETLPELAAWENVSSAVAIPEAPGSIATVVSELSYSPWVDVQSRNRGELQGDVILRGGTFEGTGFVVEGLTLMDPQTGHYAAEIPVDPNMLSAPEISFGASHAFTGFNATTGSVTYELGPIDPNVRIRASVGTDDFYAGSVYAGRVWDGGWSSDFAAAYSESDGTVEGGRHELERLTGRVRWENEDAQFDLLAGYQDKYFQWPYLYALQELHDLIGTTGIETEQIETTLVMADYERSFGDVVWGLTGFYRENKDDYEFDLGTPGLFNPYQHTTEVIGLQTSLDVPLAGGTWQTSAQFYADEIESTALVFAPFNERGYWALSTGWQGAVAEYGRTTHLLAAGLRYEDTDQDKAAWSPYARWTAELERNDATWSLYADLSQSTKVAGYTAIGSNENGGLFRGNQSLSREYAKVVETGVIYASEYGLDARASVFFRRDDDLVDWTFQNGSLFARRADNVDIDTFGAELFASLNAAWFRGQASYAYITKDEDYGASSATVDGSFYALNYAKHRFTLGAEAQLSDTVSVLWDQEYRIQADNALRTGSKDAWLHAVAVNYTLNESLTLRVSAENLLDEEFEEVPGVPGVGRIFAFSVESVF